MAGLCLKLWSSEARGAPVELGAGVRGQWGGTGCLAGGLQRELAIPQRCQRLSPASEVFVPANDEKEAVS